MKIEAYYNEIDRLIIIIYPNLITCFTSETEFIHVKFGYRFSPHVRDTLIAQLEEENNHATIDFL